MMIFIEQLSIPGEHAFALQGLAGPIEAILTVPEQSKMDRVVFLGHPHPLQGGTMNNKVVTTLVRTFKELQFPVLRFNFRGVGQSLGSFDQGIGESQDLVKLVLDWKKEQPAVKLILAGFSFGSYVTYRAAAQLKPSLLLSIAPPVDRYDYRAVQPKPHPWLVVQGDADEVVSSEAVFEFAQEESLPLLEFKDTGHFFHGKLIELKTRLLDYLNTQVSL